MDLEAAQLGMYIGPSKISPAGNANLSLFYRGGSEENYERYKEYTMGIIVEIS